MTPALLFARSFIIQWVTVWVTPFEFSFDMIEAELRRRGVVASADPERRSWKDTGPRLVLRGTSD